MNDCKYPSLDKESSSASRSAFQSSPVGGNPFEEVTKDEEDEEEGFVDPELPYQVAEVDKEGDLFDMFPSRAEEALKTCKDAEKMKGMMIRKKNSINNYLSSVPQWRH